MLCTYVLGSVLVALTFIDHFVIPSPVEGTYEELNVKSKGEKLSMEVHQCSPIPVGDRSSNLKYVLVIKSLTIWHEIKKRTLTIKTQPKIGEIAEKSLESLTDHELVKLRQICHDGLKCVSVDQLIVLKTVLKSTNNGDVSVQTVMTKITEVLTKYTTECYQGKHKYMIIKDSDDINRVSDIVTNIVNDNKVLCQIDDKAVAGENRTKNDNTTNTKFFNGTTNKDLSNNKTPNNGTLHPLFVITNGTKSAVGNKNTSSTGIQPNSTHETNSSNVKTEKDSVIVDESNNRSYSDEPVSPNEEYYKNNYVDLDNGRNDKNDIYTDIASSGSFNKNVTRKGAVENGIVNNGKMRVYNINNGVINKGTIHQAKGTNGIISVGTVNNGQTNYGVVNNSTNNGKKAKFNNFNTQMYLSSMNSIYSDMLEQFAV